MANEFHIDRAQGTTIYIDVRNGIVMNVQNAEENLNKRLNEMYVGKSISFMKKDFESFMKGIYINVRSTKYTDQLQYINATKSRINFRKNILTSLEVSKEEKEKAESKIQTDTELLYEQEKKLEEIKEEVEKEHDFIIK